MTGRMREPDMTSGPPTLSQFIDWLDISIGLVSGQQLVQRSLMAFQTSIKGLARRGSYLPRD